MPELSGPDDLLPLRARLERDRVPYCLATVVRVDGSASAKPGSKMLVSREGRNLWGWVGGGCAESFTIENALAALAEARPRLITANLDDEVFGLGMPCGGSMEIFVEPVLPPPELALPCAPDESLAALARASGFEPRFLGGPAPDTAPERLRLLAGAIAHSRGKAFPHESYSDVPRELLILGHSRITERLCELGAFVGFRVRVYGLGVTAASYPGAAEALPAAAGYQGFRVSEGSCVVVASHHKGDHHYIAESLCQGARYVGLVASRHRARLVLDHLRATGVGPAPLSRVRAPSGLDLGCRNPTEIAISIASELILLPD